MAKAKKNQDAVAAEVAAETTTQVADVAAPVQEDATEEVVEAAEEAAADAAEEVAEVENKKRTRGYAQTAISIEDHLRLTALKNHWKESLNLTVSNAQIITAALDILAQADHLEAFMKQVLNANDDKARTKDLKKLAELQAKLGVSAEASHVAAT